VERVEGGQEAPAMRLVIWIASGNDQAGSINSNVRFVADLDRQPILITKKKMRLA
jgi:hypothetical protein